MEWWSSRRFIFAECNLTFNITEFQGVDRGAEGHTTVFAGFVFSGVVAG